MSSKNNKELKQNMLGAQGNDVPSTWDKDADTDTEVKRDRLTISLKTELHQYSPD